MPRTPVFYGWHVTAVFSLLVFASAGIRHAVGPFLKPMVADLQVDRASFSLVIALGLFLYGAFMPAVGVLVDRVGARLVTAAGCAVLAGALVLTAFCRTLWELAAVYGVLASVGLAATGPVVANAVVSRWFIARRGTAVSVLGSAAMAGMSLLVPAVENAVAGASFRPGDVLTSRKGLSVEIGNTDAEGRLILADALALADEEAPELLIDFATLTGAARTALGPELPPFYTHDDGLASEIARLGQAVNDPVWRMPLWPPYERMLDSRVADLNNVATGGMAGSIVCALFLKRFVSEATSWLHFDIYAWTPAAKPGRPEGGECQAARALYKLLSERYG